MTTMIRRWRDHDNERPLIRLDPDDPVMARKPTDHREPDLSGVIEPDQELADAHRWSPAEAYRLAAHMGGHDFGVSWAAHVAGLPHSHKWTHRQLRELLFLRWLHEHGRA